MTLSNIYVKGTVFGSAKFINGVATIPFGSLAKGEHVFILNSTCLDYESQIEVNVKENTPGISVSVSPSEINLGEAVVVKITGGPNDSYVSIYVDDDYTNGVYPDLNVNLEYNINNLTAGTHKIMVVIDDADKFYSNSSYVTVKVSTSIASSAVSAVYKDSKYLVATLKDGQGKAIAGAEISTNINGLKTLKTDKNGQVYSKNNVTVTKNTRFYSNNATGATSAQCYGGAIRSEGNVKVEGSSFNDNIAGDYGGAIYAKSASIFSAKFERNKANDNHGGAVYVEDSVDVMSTTFSSNYAGDSGGAIYSKNRIFAKNTRSTANEAYYKGGAMRCEGDVIIEDCYSAYNWAYQQGAISAVGDIYIYIYIY